MVDEVPCPPVHDTTSSVRTRAPVSFKRMLGSQLFSKEVFVLRVVCACSRICGHLDSASCDQTQERSLDDLFMPRDPACKLAERERVRCLVQRPKDRVVENALGLAHSERWLPNGSRLSCGASAGWRKRPALRYRLAGAQTSASAESRPRQLQALVRQPGPQCPISRST